MVKENYQQKLDQILQQLEAESRKATLLLHSCCGPCSSYVVTYLSQWFDITVLYYNPNIYPEEEYRKRLSEQARLLKALQIPLVDIPYSHQEFLDAVKGFEAEPEGGARCERCFRLRLQKTRELAEQMGLEYYATTLTVSPHKNAMVINRIGYECSSQGGPRAQEDGAKQYKGSVLWLPSDFKKRDGYKKSIELSRQYRLYRQSYCGCEFAMGHLQ